MADKKIIDLTDIVTQLPTDLYETSADGSGSYKESRSQMLNFIQRYLTPSATVTLTSNTILSSFPVGIICNFSSPGGTVQLPSALTAPYNFAPFIFCHPASQSVQILDGSGGALFTINPGNAYQTVLIDDSTVAGTWDPPREQTLLVNNDFGDVTVDSQSAYDIGTGSIETSSGKPVSVVSTGVTPAADASSLLDSQSTTQGVRVFPAMTTTQRDAISSPAKIQIYNTTTDTIDYYDGINWETLLTIDNLIGGTNITITNNGDGTVTISSSGSGFSVGGSAYYNILSGATTSFSDSSPIPLSCTVNKSKATDMTVGSNGSITATSAGTYLFQASISGRSSSTANVFYFYFSINGTVDFSSLQAVYFANGIASNSGSQANPLALYTLNPGDVVRVYVANPGSLSNSFIAQTMSVSASQDLASSATLQSAYNNGNTISQLTASSLMTTDSGKEVVSGNLTGDITTSGLATTLATVNSNVGSFGSSIQVGTFTVNSKGLITAASNTAITGVPPGGAAGGDLSSTYPNPTVSKINGASLGSTTATSGNLLVGSGSSWVSNAVSGDATLSSSGALILDTVNLSPGTYGNGTQVAQVTVNSKGLVTSASSITITGAPPSGAAGGDLSGTYPTPTVSQINGSPLGTISASTPGNILVAQGGHWNSQSMSGDATIGGGGAISFATVNASPGTYGDSSHSLTANVNAKGLVTSLSANSIQIAESQVINLTTDLAAKLALAGGTMTGNLILNADPTASAQAATKNYVDMTAAGLQIKTAVTASTTANLVGTYNNGTSGVGATFTMTATGVLTLDGQTVILGNRYLIKNQSSGFQNGIYDCTVAGAVGVATVFTRSANYNTAADMDAGSLVPIINGTTWGGTTWLQTATITTVGTDNLVFSEFGSGPTTLTGDVTGSGFSPTSTSVVAINGNPLGSTAPTNGNILKANGTQWATASPAALTSSNDTNVTITLGGSASTALINAASLTIGWTGTLAAGRLNSNVVQAITNDTNVTGSISAQTLTLGWTGTLSAARINFNSTNLKNSSGSLNVVQDISAASSPTFYNQTLTGAGVIQQTIQSTTTGSANYANLILMRGDNPNGYNIIQLGTAGVAEWNIAEYANSTQLKFHDSTNNIDQFVINQGSGTSGSVGIAGSLTSGNSITVSNGNIIANTATNGFQQKGASVSGGTANAFFVSGVVLTAGSSGTINNSSVTTSCAGFASVSTSGGTLSLGYRVICNNGSFSVSGTNALDTSTLNVFFIKGI